MPNGNVNEDKIIVLLNLMLIIYCKFVNFVAYCDAMWKPIELFERICKRWKITFYQAENP